MHIYISKICKKRERTHGSNPISMLDFLGILGHQKKQPPAARFSGAGSARKFKQEKFFGFYSFCFLKILFCKCVIGKLVIFPFGTERNLKFMICRKFLFSNQMNTGTQWFVVGQKGEIFILLIRRKMQNNSIQEPSQAGICRPTF